MEEKHREELTKNTSQSKDKKTSEQKNQQKSVKSALQSSSQKSSQENSQQKKNQIKSTETAVPSNIEKNSDTEQLSGKTQLKSINSAVPPVHKSSQDKPQQQLENQEKSKEAALQANTSTKNKLVKQSVSENSQKLAISSLTSDNHKSSKDKSQKQENQQKLTKDSLTSNIDKDLKKKPQKEKIKESFDSALKENQQKATTTTLPSDSKKQIEKKSTSEKNQPQLTKLTLSSDDQKTLQLKSPELKNQPKVIANTLPLDAHKTSQDKTLLDKSLANSTLTPGLQKSAQQQDIQKKLLVHSTKQKNRQNIAESILDSNIEKALLEKPTEQVQKSTTKTSWLSDSKKAPEDRSQQAQNQNLLKKNHQVPYDDPWQSQNFHILSGKALPLKTYEKAFNSQEANGKTTNCESPVTDCSSSSRITLKNQRSASLTPQFVIEDHIDSTTSERDTRSPSLSPFASTMFLQPWEQQQHLTLLQPGGLIDSLPTTQLSTRRSSFRGAPHVVCYVCSRKFPPDAIEEHEVNCLKVWRNNNMKLPPRLRQPEPSRNSSSQSSATFMSNDDSAWEGSNELVVLCDNCGRPFHLDRLLVHQKSCK